jgi:predicted RNA-binding Zn-ribbon protein involved in translation (DUF1610 family)
MLKRVQEFLAQRKPLSIPKIQNICVSDAEFFQKLGAASDFQTPTSLCGESSIRRTHKC